MNEMKRMNWLYRVSVGRQRERYDKSHADYVQFVDDKKRQQLSYNDEQIHKYRRYDTTHTRPHKHQTHVLTVPHTRPHKYSR